MQLTAEQANAVFDILIAKGNYDTSSAGYLAMKREEFVHSLSEGEMGGEYWYPSACGSSIKVYFDVYRIKSPIWVFAQTYNPSKEKTLVADTNAAFEEFVAAERAKIVESMG